ncbi:mitochondrial import inner membrane translocase subunit Tim10 B [Pungitius pungitius]|uniref:mitochondrial import inner membrane translocase subunit Tim10 B n=1 Tax=Pungitius pungitius TaxID=134920 RepID=UPI002E11D084
MEPEQQLRNLRDFLLVYNRMTEICFQRCSSNFNYRNLTMDEERCVDSCAGKLIRSNHRLMGTYVQLMPRMVQRRMEEMESKAKAAEAAAASAHVEPPAMEASVASQTPATFSQVPQGAPLLERPLASMAIDDAGPQALGSVLKPVGVPVELDAGKSARASEVQLSAATPLTPVVEAAHFPLLKEAAPGPSHAAGAPQSASSAPGFTPYQPEVAVPTGSKSIGSLSGRQRAPEAPPPPPGQE